MIKCKECKKKIKSLVDVFQLTVYKENSSGDGDTILELGEFHDGCCTKFIKKLNKCLKTSKGVKNE